MAELFNPYVAQAALITVRVYALFNRYFVIVWVLGALLILTTLSCVVMVRGLIIV